MTSPDPFRPPPGAGEAGRARQVADLESRVSALERNGQRPDVFAGAPSGSRAEGTMGAQLDVPRLWIRVGNVWRYTALT